MEAYSHNMTTSCSRVYGSTVRISVRLTNTSWAEREGQRIATSLTKVVELAGGGALFLTRAAAHDRAAYGGGLPTGACVGLSQSLEVTWAGFLVAEGFRGEKGRGRRCVLGPMRSSA